MATYLITETYIKQNSPVTEAIQMKDLFPHILAAQELYIQDIIGSEFYNHILTAFNDETLTADEITLVQDFIKPAILWRTISLALPWLQFNLRAKGVLTNTDDNAVPTSTLDLKFLLNEAVGRAQFNEDLIRKYLCKNGNLFPLYQSQDGLTPPNKRSRFGNGLIMY